MSFDTLAAHYRWMEFVLAGNKLHRCRTAFLGEMGDAQNILLLGEGNGRFLLPCRRRFPKARITCVDASGPMLQQARRRLQKHGLSAEGIEFTQADALIWRPPVATYDLIVTHFFLDCFRPEQLEPLLAKLAKAAKPQAAWLLADFQVPAKGLQQHRARIILGMMYLFFSVVTRLPARELTSPDDLLVGNGFALRERRVSEWALLRSDRWALR